MVKSSISVSQLYFFVAAKLENPIADKVFEALNVFLVGTAVDEV